MDKKKKAEASKDEIIEEKKRETKEVEMEKETDWKVMAEENLNKWKRVAADFENYKKRQAESFKDTIAFANTNLLVEILPVVDNFYASIEHIPEDQKENPWVVGIMHIQKQLEKVLEDNGVSEIQVKKGDKFDPMNHEALESKAEKKKECKDIISKVVTRGYKMGGRVIRAARVIVG